MTIRIKTVGFQQLAEKYLGVKATAHNDIFEITMPFTVGRAKKGAIVIHPEGFKDIFDLPPPELKKLIQGVIWRDEHFAGKTLTEIAQRESCSDAHVGKCIMHSFDILQAA